MKLNIAQRAAVLFGAVCVLWSLSPTEAAAAEEKAQTAAAPPSEIIKMLRDPEVLTDIGRLPVLDRGRVKPLDTVARFRLLRYHGKQSIIVDEKIFGEKTNTLNAVEWMLMTWFQPELAKDMPVFIVDNSDAVVVIGVPAKKQRDRYSYNELLPGRAQLMQKMQEIRTVEEKKRTPIQRALGTLSMSFLDYEMMLSHFDFARSPFGNARAEVPESLVGKDQPVPRIAELLPKLDAHFKANPGDAAPMANPWLREFYRAILGAMMSGSEEQTLRIFPPSAKDNETWQSPGSLMHAGIEGAPVDPAQMEDLTQWEGLYFALNDPAAFKAQLKKVHDVIVQDAEKRGEYGFVKMEVSYHAQDYFYKALLCFFPGLIILGLSWASPGSLWGKACRVLCWLLVACGAVYATVGIVVRCIIMQRPPVTTLYETIIFITCTGVILALIAEWLTRKQIALTVAALVGTAGMFVSIRYMNMEGTDTLQQLQAVLITNFWLATHVPIINLGYAAGMVSAILAMIYLVLRVVGVTKRGSDMAKDITRISYGFLIVGLFLSLVGTVLGGIWANYSWGRFWGWDPKENGALMIVLMTLITLHARLGGYIKEVGFHATNIVLGMIVVFSWFGVNQLGVGLHSYGFTDGIWYWLRFFWASQLVFLLVAFGIWLWDRKNKSPLAHSGASGPDTKLSKSAYRTAN